MLPPSETPPIPEMVPPLPPEDPPVPVLPPVLDEPPDAGSPPTAASEPFVAWVLNSPPHAAIANAESARIKPLLRVVMHPSYERKKAYDCNTKLVVRRTLAA
jgi:hypothetical protein